MERLTEERQLGPFASLKDKAEAKPGAFADYACFYAHELAVTRLKKYEDTGLEPEEIMALISQPNPPLTLEELREMDGEPVWLISLEGLFTPQWRLIWVKDTFEFERDGLFFSFLDETNYGKTWLAYRRKPEKEEA